MDSTVHTYTSASGSGTRVVSRDFDAFESAQRAIPRLDIPATRDSRECVVVEKMTAEVL